MPNNFIFWIATKRKGGKLVSFLRVIVCCRCLESRRNVSKRITFLRRKRLIFFFHVPCVQPEPYVRLLSTF